MTTNEFPFVHVNSFQEVVPWLQHPGKVFIYKHSTRCGVSFAAMRRLMQLEPKDDEHWIYIDVVGQRPISLGIAEALDVWHQSPQLILLQDGKVLEHTSHSGVNEDTVAAWRAAH